MVMEPEQVLTAVEVSLDLPVLSVQVLAVRDLSPDQWDPDPEVLAVLDHADPSVLVDLCHHFCKK